MEKAAPCRMVLVTVDPHSNNGVDVAPAVIVRAWSDTEVNVRVLRDGPDVPWMCSVPLFQTREELEAERDKRAARWRQVSDQPVPLFHGAYWPPRV